MTNDTEDSHDTLAEELGERVDEALRGDIADAEEIENAFLS